MDSKTAKKKLRYSFKKPRLIPGKCPDETVQKKTVKEMKALFKKAQKGIIEVVFADPTHKVHNTIPARCWQKRGKSGTIVVRSNSGRKRVTVLGFFNPIRLKFTSFVTESNCDRAAVEMAHEELKKEYPDGKEIVVIQDNAKYNHAYGKSEHAKNLHIIPYFLPPYCPNLNLIERIWKFMKSAMMHNAYYETFPEFLQAIINFCSHHANGSPEIKSLMTQKFEILKAA